MGRAAVLVAMVLVVAGCSGARSDPGAAPSASGSPIVTPTSAATPVATPLLIVLRKTGGFAGVDERLEVIADGSWTFTTDGAMAKQGRLTAAQLAELHRLATSPALADEARRKGQGGACNDGFVYRLSVDGLTMSAEHCGGPADLPTFDAVVRLLTDATPI